MQIFSDHHGVSWTLGDTKQGEGRSRKGGGYDKLAASEKFETTPRFFWINRLLQEVCDPLCDDRLSHRVAQEKQFHLE